jgi:hypothetical protein
LFFVFFFLYYRPDFVGVVFDLGWVRVEERGKREGRGERNEREGGGRRGKRRKEEGRRGQMRAEEGRGGKKRKRR